MSAVSKLFTTEQLKISQLNFGDLNAILSDGESTIYVDANNVLKIATKNGLLVEEKNAAGDVIKSLDADELPSTFPLANTGYALIAVQDGTNFKLVWGLVDTNGNYNVIGGSTTYTVVFTDPSVQIFNPATPGNYPFNGIINITVSGDGALAGKRYSIDGGTTFTSILYTPSYEWQTLGSLTGETYNLIVEDVNNETLHTDTITLNPPDYSWDFISQGLYTPPDLIPVEHLIYKSDDTNPTIPGIEIRVKVIVEDDGADYYPALYKYDFYLDGILILDSPYTQDTEYVISSGVGTGEGTWTAVVTRKNPGYVRLGVLNIFSSPTYYPSVFTWSTDNGNTFSSPANSTPPFSLNPITNEITISYSADSLDVGSNKTIYMKEGFNIYQYTHSLTQSPITSVEINPGVLVTGTTGLINDFNFSSSFIFSDSYDIPNIIPRNSPMWSSPSPGATLSFKILYLDTSYYGSLTTQLSLRIEDINGTLVATEIATLSNDDPINGQEFSFNIPNFDTLIGSPPTGFSLFGEVIRFRFTFTPDNTVMPPNPDNDILSKLKFVKFLP